MAIATLPSGTAVAPTAAAPARERSRTWRKLARNPAALAGTLILLVVVVAALGAPWVAPHDPAKQSLVRRFLPPAWAPGGNSTYLLGTDQDRKSVV